MASEFTGLNLRIPIILSIRGGLMNIQALILGSLV